MREELSNDQTTQDETELLGYNITGRYSFVQFLKYLKIIEKGISKSLQSLTRNRICIFSPRERSIIGSSTLTVEKLNENVQPATIVPSKIPR